MVALFIVGVIEVNVGEAVVLEERGGCTRGGEWGGRGEQGRGGWYGMGLAELGVIRL